MNKVDLINKIAEATKDGNITKKDIDRVIGAFVDVVIHEVTNGGDVVLVDFGKLSSIAVPERKGRNPRTGEAIVIPEHKKVVFKAGKGFKDAVNR